MAILRLFFAACCLLSIGCHEFDSLSGMPSDLATDVEDGVYTGPLELEMRAYMGPVLVKQGYCDTEIELKVRNYARTLIRGDVQCDMDGLGMVSVDITGDPIDTATVYGIVDADDLSAVWTGWFYGHDSLYGETVGETKQNGVRIEYWGYFDVQRTELIHWRHRPEHSDQLTESEAGGLGR